MIGCKIVINMCIFCISRKGAVMSVVAHDEAQSLKERIFAAAITVFAEHGLSGARMEQIATEAQTTKRMVVYYFKTKELLYQAVLQHVYADPRNRAAARAGKRTAGRGAGAAGEVERALSRHAR
jgi:AcrR family transcriptional regulator